VPASTLANRPGRTRLWAMKLLIALTCFLVAVVGNTWELTYSPPRWPVLVIGFAFVWVALTLLMEWYHERGRPKLAALPRLRLRR
jgi:hypothetical protein